MSGSWSDAPAYAGAEAATLLLARAHEVLDSSGQVVTAVLDEEGCLQAASPSATAVLGWDTADLVGTAGLDLVHPADRGQLHALRLADSPTAMQRVELRIRHGRGGWRWLELQALPLPGPTDDEVGGWVVQGWDVTARWRAEQSLRHAATHDAMTQLPNRVLLMDRIDRALRRQARHPFAVALAYLDLDGFKAVNDTLGHAAGDRLLQDAAAVLARGVRGQDTLARVGGDEFVVLLEDLHPEDAALHAAATVTRLLSAITALGAPAPAPGIGCSAGLLVVAAGTDRTAQDLLGSADQAMYEAKSRRIPGSLVTRHFP